MQLGRAYRLKGDLEGARSQFLDVIHGGQDVLAARYELADLSLTLHRPQEAVQQAKRDSEHAAQRSPRPVSLRPRLDRNR